MKEPELVLRFFCFPAALEPRAASGAFLADSVVVALVVRFDDEMP
ncbi:hypothetical protein AHiyo8_29360 [Arthrobacter sp. Hiyo8]|nr:hypothetical protein AHiyo8_29360 [Arthrobacter sp. Hiyo8]